MNQLIKNSEFSEQVKPKSKFKWLPYRTLPCTVTLQGLVVGSHKHTPVELKNKLIPWDRTIIRASLKLATLFESDSKPLNINGRGIQLKFESERAARVALRAKDRYLCNAWRNGELSLDHKYEISNKGRKQVWTIMSILALICLSLSWLFVNKLLHALSYFTGQHYFLMLLVIAGLILHAVGLLVVVFWLLLHASKSNLKSISLNTEGIEVALLDGRNLLKSWYEITNIKRCRFSFEVICSSGEKFAIPASGPIRPILELIQREIYTECEIEEKQALQRSMNRSYIWCFIGGIISAGLTVYLQSQGLTATSGPFPAIGIFIAIGILLPAFMMFSNWYETRRKQQTGKRRRCGKETESHAEP